MIAEMLSSYEPGLLKSRNFVMLSGSEASRANVRGDSSLRLSVTKLLFSGTRHDF